MKISVYDTMIFDCDGVLLNSNPIKAKAMFDAASHWGEEAASELVTFHNSRGGIARWIKFEHFFQAILGRVDDYSDDMALLQQRYTSRVRDRLAACEKAEGVTDLLAGLRASGTKLFVVSGADQKELRDILTHHGLAVYFDGIFGAPDNKIDIINREMAEDRITGRRLFLGDSHYDMEAAQKTGCDFIFVAGWSEVEDPEKTFRDLGAPVIDRLADLQLTMEGQGQS